MNVNLSPEVLATLPQAEQDIYNATPIWATIAFAVAVFAGTIGSLGLVLRKRWAKPLLIASLVGVAVQMFHAFVLAKGLEVYGMERMVMPLMIVLIAAFLVWYANMMDKKGWLS